MNPLGAKNHVSVAVGPTGGHPALARGSRRRPNVGAAPAPRCGRVRAHRLLRSAIAGWFAARSARSLHATCLSVWHALPDLALWGGGEGEGGGENRIIALPSRFGCPPRPGIATLPTPRQGAELTQSQRHRRRLRAVADSQSRGRDHQSRRRALRHGRRRRFAVGLCGRASNPIL